MPDFHDLPASHGTYVLHLAISHSQPLTIGHLGRYDLPVGDYFYVGSARGAGGLQTRVGRHLRGDGALHWHIDYLRAVAEVRDVLYTATDNALECSWSQTLVQLPHAFTPVPHFGSGDCRSDCAAHLIAFPRNADITSLLRVLERVTGTSIVHLRFL